MIYTGNAIKDKKHNMSAKELERQVSLLQKRFFKTLIKMRKNEMTWQKIADTLGLNHRQEVCNISKTEKPISTDRIISFCKRLEDQGYM